MRPLPQTNLVTVGPDASLAEVTQLLAGPPAIEGLPVVDAAKKVGWAGFVCQKRSAAARLQHQAAAVVSCSAAQRLSAPTRAVFTPQNPALQTALPCPVAAGSRLQEGPEQSRHHRQGMRGGFLLAKRSPPPPPPSGSPAALPAPRPVPAGPHPAPWPATRLYSAQDIMSTPAISLKATGKVADAAVCMTEVRAPG